MLKPGGTLRVCCPDAKFLYQVSTFENDYWGWRKETLADTRNYETDFAELTQSDFLVRELATPKFRFYKDRVSDALNPFDVAETDYQTLCENLRSDLPFRAEHPEDHINNWDFDRIEALGKSCGFSHIIESKPQGSVSAAMQGRDFDRSRPEISLYVDLVK